MKRHVHAPQRTVTVEDGTVRDLDGNQLGSLWHSAAWRYRPRGGTSWSRDYSTQSDAVAALLADPSCPAGGPNLYDREGTR